MANSITNKGEEYGLVGDGSGDGSIARKAASVRLFQSTSSPNKDGSGFNEVANGNGYTTGGNAITVANWTFSVQATNGQIILDDQVFTAAGGTIPNIAGAYIQDSGSEVLAWWERSVITLSDGDSLTLDDLTIRLT